MVENKNTCAIFTLNQSAAAFAQFFHIQEVPVFPTGHNIAPRQIVATVLHISASKECEFHHLGSGLTFSHLSLSTFRVIVAAYQAGEDVAVD
ncbi:hypothetical protein Cylst_0093 [Cylindrospermum stagnale PCC 7417]|uniref:Uncharacterized protein n=1 Tax=Cylindrospermum stagnale PCC 7417 TaxID=56107 RepID=K9WRQ9_9NOST|nr:hypothetical protein [Cylindrospermum stagnale]AFZ22471.1 hypothetical protein Cylst_0093 [Cylindrospermum stagnale PCC 7417]